MFAALSLVLALLAAAPPARSRPPLAVPGAPDPPRRAARRAPVPLPEHLAEVLARFPGDGLAGPLRAFELAHPAGSEGAEAAFTLGQLHYARGEYHQAADAFARAAARFSPQRKPEARYWQGLSALGWRDWPQARSALEEVAESASPRRAAARFAVALVWEQAGRAERALETLAPLAVEGPSDITPAALEKLAELEDRMGDRRAATQAADRLRREYPQSIETMRLPPPVAPEPETRARPEPGGFGVQIGAFSEEPRARALFDLARRSGFPHAELATQGRGAARLHVVRIGWYGSEAAARKAGEDASRSLGVAYRLVRKP
jgi:tetratricopeptide (TPR) repeat protein